MEEQIGPKEVYIPAKRYLSCWGCKYFDHHMIKSGKNPLYANDCIHPLLPEDKKYFGLLGPGNLGRNEETPDWCPVLKLNK